MALSIYASGSQDISSPGGWILGAVVGPGAFVALLDFQHHDGIEVRVWWANEDGAEVAAIWSEHRTIDTADIGVAAAVLTPPVPIAVAGGLRFDFYTGTPGSPASVPWTVYKL